MNLSLDEYSYTLCCVWWFVAFQDSTMKRQHVINCTFSKWYPLFRQWTIKSKIIKLPEDFIKYLLEDGIVLPAANGNSGEELGPNQIDNSSINDVIPDDWSDCDDESFTPPTFPQLQIDVERAITELGGTVFPKLNWSSPKDARWISADGTLKCKSFSDICLLLKSSDFIVHDLTKAFEYCEDSTECLSHDGFELVLRKWTDISTASEFRCFVRKDQLVAITQRDTMNSYDFLLINNHIIHADITKFFKMKIKSKFIESSFAFDIWRNGDGKVKLIDVNPFSPYTDSLLFSWQELRNELDDCEISTSETQGELRLVPKNAVTMQPSQFLSYQLPKDAVDLARGENINNLLGYLN